MSYFYCQNTNGGRQMRPLQHSVMGSPNGKLIHSPKSLVIVEGSAGIASALGSSSFGVVTNLNPGVGGTQRALLLYIGASNRITPMWFEITFVRSGVDDTFLFECVGDQLTTDQEKGDYYLAIYASHSTTNVTFRQSAGDATVGNSYTYSAMYGNASFRQEALNV